MMCAFDLPTTDVRNHVRKQCYEHGLVILGCGERTIRFRPALTLSVSDIDEGLARLEQALDDVVA
jgi:L-lysine 6-transaminase